jgi:hypothetical protein
LRIADEARGIGRQRDGFRARGAGRRVCRCRDRSLNEKIPLRAAQCRIDYDDDYDNDRDPCSALDVNNHVS